MNRLPTWQRADVQLLQVCPDPEMTASWTVGIATDIVECGEKHQPLRGSDFQEQGNHATSTSREAIFPTPPENLVIEGDIEAVEAAQGTVRNNREQARLLVTAGVVVAFALVSFWSSRTPSGTPTDSVNETGVNETGDAKRILFQSTGAR